MKNIYTAIYKGILVLSVITLYSCSILYNDQSAYTKTINTVELGKIGSVHKSFGKAKQFIPQGTPILEENVRVHLAKLPFNKYTIKKYNVHVRRVMADHTINYVDSIAEKPKFFTAVISDKIKMVSILNQEKNTAIVDYLKLKNKHVMVSEISFTVTKELEQSLTGVEEVFLYQDGPQKLGLSFFKMGKKVKEVDFSEIAIFDYKTSGFCWMLNKRMEPYIGMLTRAGEECPEGANNVPSKLDVDRAYLKF